MGFVFINGFYHNTKNIKKFGRIAKVTEESAIVKFFEGEDQFLKEEEYTDFLRDLAKLKLVEYN